MIGGIVLYVTLFLLTLFGLFYGLLIIPPYPYSFSVAISLLFGATFIFHQKGWVTSPQLGFALPILFLILSGSLFLSAQAIDTDSCLLILALCAVVGLICWASIFTAHLISAKWSSVTARRRSMKIVSLLPLITCGFLFVFFQFRFLYTAQRALKPTPPTIKCDAITLNHTQVIPTLDTPIEPGTNLIWCASFQLAWNEMIDILGKELRFESNEPLCVSNLNLRTVTIADLDPKTVLSTAGFYTPELVKKLNHNLKKQFGNHALPPETPPANSSDLQLAAFSYLSVNLPFKHAFERIDSPFRFQNQPVEGFGIEGYSYPEKGKFLAAEQILVYANTNQLDIIVELISRKTKHHLIFAKIPPESTLVATIKAVNQRMDSIQPKTGLEHHQNLKIPLFNFDITKNYAQLTNQPLINRNAKHIAKAQQNIRFQLDERGGVLKSHSLIFSIFSIAPVSHLIFDAPFLVMIRYGDSPQPYFALWVDNAEILVPAKKK